MIKNAIFSKENPPKHRYLLTRIWNDQIEIPLIIGLNPSRANEENDDPTNRRLIKLVKYNKYGGYRLVNVFAEIEPNSSKLAIKDRIHPTNLDCIIQEIEKARTIILAYGNKGKKVANQLGSYLKEKHLLCFDCNKNGSPKHPLYIKSKTVLHEYCL